MTRTVWHVLCIERAACSFAAEKIESAFWIKISQFKELNLRQKIKCKSFLKEKKKTQLPSHPMALIN